MSSGFINETLKQSISQLEKVSDDIFQEVAELNAHNPNLFRTTTTVPSTSVQGNVSDSDYGLVEESTPGVNSAEINEKLVTIQSSFDRISVVVSKIKDVNFLKSIRIEEVVKALKPFEQGSLIDQIDTSQWTNQYEVKHFKLISKLENLVLLYSVAAIYQILLTKILKFTIPLNDNYYYYDITLNSNWRTLLYSLQTLPGRIVKLFQKVLTEISSNKLPTIESLDVEIPEFMDSYPTVANIYLKFRLYVNVVLKSLYNNIISNNIKGFYKKSSNAFKFNSIGLNKTKRNFIHFKNYVGIIIGTPLNSIHEELKDQKFAIESKQMESAKTLGYLISNIPNFKELISEPSKIDEFLTKLIRKTNGDDDNDDLELINSSSTSNCSFTNLYKFSNHLTETFETSNKFKLEEYKKPNFLTRYWPSILIGIIYGPETIRATITNRDLILKFIKEKLVDTVLKFYQNWILKPLTDIFSTIRHDSNSDISIMSQQSLGSELDSLKRMVIDYTIETTPSMAHLSEHDLNGMKANLDELITKGDLTPFMEGYESDIKSPLKNLVNGKLTRGLLIQLQKTKVDGSVAISGIDKLLKSQQLVFGVIAASPAVLIVVYVSRLLKQISQRGFHLSVGDVGERKLIISKNLNNVERLLNKLNEGFKDDDDEYDRISGLLLLEIFSLRKNGILVIPKNRRDEWIRDITDLIKNDDNVTREGQVGFKLNTVGRIYHVYGGFF
jgi:nuclear-control-of-ATPase protein 2